MMEELYKLKEMLCDELEQYGRKGELTTGSLDVVDKLAHAMKSIATVIAMEEAEGEYSQMDGGDRYNMRGNSYARRGGARRDSMGRYSRTGYSGAVDDMIEKLNDLMQDAPNEDVRHEIKRLVSKVEKM